MTIGLNTNRMKHILILLIICQSLYLFGQSESVKFDNTFRFKNGIYTTNTEILTNNPKYPDYLIAVKTGIATIFDEPSYYYYKDTCDKKPFDDFLFAFVYDGQLLIHYKNNFHKLILTGAISTFFTEVIYNYTDRYSKAYDQLYFVDFMSGAMDKLNPETIDDIIKQDSLLYSEFSSLSYSKQKKILYSFVLKYNKRNPVFITLE